MTIHVADINYQMFDINKTRPKNFHWLI